MCDIVTAGLKEGAGPRDLAARVIKVAFDRKSGDNCTATVLLLDFGAAKSQHLGTCSRSFVLFFPSSQSLLQRASEVWARAGTGDSLALCVQNACGAVFS